MGWMDDVTPEGVIVYCARVSNPSNQRNFHTGHRLLKYCIQHGHWSVFEMVDWTVEIETSRAIATQILRHRSFSFQEFSQRYSNVKELVEAIQPVEMRPVNPGGNRQGSDETEQLKHPHAVRGLVENHMASCVDLYDRLIEEGVAPECARMVLPLAATTRLYMKGSVRSWIHYLRIRCDSHTQKEHRDVANAVMEHFKIQFPVIGELI